MEELGVLDGTPYSLPHDAATDLRRLEWLTADIRAKVTTAARKAEGMGLLRQIRLEQNYRVVYESNALEFEGPDLAGTVRAITSRTGQDIVQTLNTNLLPEILKRDPKAYAAIGLESARVLSESYIDHQRSVLASDVRSLHAMIMAGTWHAGRYRPHDVKLKDAVHLPPAHYKVPAEMQELVEWKSSCVEESPILRAAVAHAWLGHIHPFKDGNGRVARLLTNVMLGQAGLPPAIVKASSQRTKYLNALAHSDEGGDLLPLAGLFADTLHRYASDMEKPRLLPQAVRRPDCSSWHLAL